MSLARSRPAGTVAREQRLKLADEIVETCRRMNALGLNQGSAGNISHRLDDEHFFVTPSGIPYDRMRQEDVPVMDMRARWYGGKRPSVEWRFHRDILANRPETTVVLHTHSMFSTILACMRRDIPAFHYMVGVGGGDTIRCASYATFGTQKLSDNALAALEGRRACLLANHGLIVLATSLEKALSLAVEVETLSAMYCRVLQVGEPHILGKAEMKRILELFNTYGTPAFPDADLAHGGDQWPGTVR
jgi:L-fuculose-phosphate aldolase